MLYDENVARYSPPDDAGVDEFQLDRVKLDAVGQTASVPPYEGLAIAVVVAGTCEVEQIEPAARTKGPRHTLKMGDVRLICPHTQLSVTAQSPECLLFVGSAKDVPIVRRER